MLVWWTAAGGVRGRNALIQAVVLLLLFHHLHSPIQLWQDAYDCILLSVSTLNYSTRGLTFQLFVLSRCYSVTSIL